MKPKAYELIQRCVDDGIARGWTRAHKHVEDPDPDTVQEQISLAVMAELCEWFAFDLPGDIT